MSFSKWLTGQHQMVHDTITNFANSKTLCVREGLCPDTILGHHDEVVRQSIPFPGGMIESWKDF